MKRKVGNEEMYSTVRELSHPLWPTPVTRITEDRERLEDRDDLGQMMGVVVLGSTVQDGFVTVRGTGEDDLHRVTVRANRAVVQRSEKLDVPACQSCRLLGD